MLTSRLKISLGVMVLLAVIAGGIYGVWKSQSIHSAELREKEEASHRWVETTPVFEEGTPGWVYYEDAWEGVGFYYPEKWGTLKLEDITDYDLIFVDDPDVVEAVRIYTETDHPQADDQIPWKWVGLQETNIFNGTGDDWIYMGQELTEANEQDYCNTAQEGITENAYWDQRFENDWIELDNCRSFQNNAGNWVTHLYLWEGGQNYNVYVLRFPDARFKSIAFSDKYLSVEEFGEDVNEELASVVMSFTFVPKPVVVEPESVVTTEVSWTGEKYEAVTTTTTYGDSPAWCYDKKEYRAIGSETFIDFPEELDRALGCYAMYPAALTPDENYFLYFPWQGDDSDQLPLKQFNMETGEVKTLMSLYADPQGLNGFYWNPSHTRFALVVTNPGLEDYPDGSKIFVIDWANGELTQKQKLDAKVKVGFSNEGYFPDEFGWLDDDTLKYRVWTESFYEWDEWDTFLDDDEALAQEPVYETVEL